MVVGHAPLPGARGETLVDRGLAGLLAVVPLNNLFERAEAGLLRNKNKAIFIFVYFIQPPLRPAVPPSPDAYEARPQKKVVDATAWLW